MILTCRLARPWWLYYSSQISWPHPARGENTGLWLVNTGHVTWILTSDWLEYMCPVNKTGYCRLAAVTFLHDMYKHTAVSNNPFAPVFIQLLSPPDTLDPGDDNRWREKFVNAVKNLRDDNGCSSVCSLNLYHSLTYIKGDFITALLKLTESIRA